MNLRLRLCIALALAAAVAAAEFWGGALAHSIALTTDAVHVCMDVFALAVALFASAGAMRPANRRKTFGYGRVEILAALFNGAVLLAATAVIAFEAVRRFGAPVEPRGWLMTMVAAGGLAVNLAIAFTLTRSGDGHGHEHADLNTRAAVIHVAGDALGAFAVIVGGIAIGITHAAWIDPLMSLVVAAMIVAGVYGIVRDAADVLLESTPRGLDAQAVEASIRGVAGVAGVHDLHVWSIASRSHALSTHVVLDDRRISEAASVVSELRGLLERSYDISHITVQLESEHCDPGGVIICVPEDEQR